MTGARCAGHILQEGSAAARPSGASSRCASAAARAASARRSRARGSRHRPRAASRSAGRCSRSACAAPGRRCSCPTAASRCPRPHYRAPSASWRFSRNAAACAAMPAASSAIRTVVVANSARGGNAHQAEIGQQANRGAERQTKRPPSARLKACRCRRRARRTGTARPRCPRAARRRRPRPRAPTATSSRPRPLARSRAHFAGHFPAVPRHPDIVPGQHHTATLRIAALNSSCPIPANRFDSAPAKAATTQARERPPARRRRSSDCDAAPCA
jgi:hypothetical protein